MARKGRGSIELEMDFLNLMPGSYYIGIGVASYNEGHDDLDNIARLDVEPSDYYGTGRGVEARFGMIFLPFRWIATGNGNSLFGASCDNGSGGCDSEGNGVALPVGSISSHNR